MNDALNFTKDKHANKLTVKVEREEITKYFKEQLSKTKGARFQTEQCNNCSQKTLRFASHLSIWPKLFPHFVSETIK